MKSARAVLERWLCHLQLVDLRPKLLNFPKVDNTSIEIYSEVCNQIEGDSYEKCTPST